MISIIIIIIDEILHGGWWNNKVICNTKAVNPELIVTHREGEVSSAIDYLCPRDAIFVVITWSILVEVMVWCCLNQCWLMINEVFWYSFTGNVKYILKVLIALWSPYTYWDLRIGPLWSMWTKNITFYCFKQNQKAMILILIWWAQLSNVYFWIIHAIMPKSQHHFQLQLQEFQLQFQLRLWKFQFHSNFNFGNFNSNSDSSKSPKCQLQHQLGLLTPAVLCPRFNLIHMSPKSRD